MIDCSLYDYVVVGAGLSGSVFARRVADAGKKVLVLERRDAVGGNLFDYETKYGIRVQKYGPHTFHTNNQRVIDFVKRFSEFDDFKLKCEVNIDGILTPSPFNFTTIDQFYDKKKAKILKEKLLTKYKEKTITIFELLRCDDLDISNYANFLLKKDYELYTSKQWGITLEEIDREVLKRVPVFLSYDCFYFRDVFEGIPKLGFSHFIKSLLHSDNIDVVCKTDALTYIKIVDDKLFFNGHLPTIIYTGELDRLFDYKYGRLPYRSLKFVYEVHDYPFQNVSIVAYPSHKYKFTRITEYTKLPYQHNKKTIISKEFPCEFREGNEPFYPILTSNSIKQYNNYKNDAAAIDNLKTLGRLAEFRYYNMDQAVLSALLLADSCLKEE